MFFSFPFGKLESEVSSRQYFISVIDFFLKNTLQIMSTKHAGVLHENLLLCSLDDILHFSSLEKKMNMDAE